MNYLYGDSSESNLDFNYLAFLREALDCAVVLVEHEATLGSGDRRRAKEKEAQLAVQSIEELGRHAAALFDPVVKEYGETPVGRAAGAITAAVREVIATESAKVNLSLGTALEAMTTEDGKLRTRSLAALDKLLRTYDLPAATRGYDIAWEGKAAPKKVLIGLRTPYAIDAMLDGALPSSHPFATGELRVDKLADNVEIASVEAGGWIKKSDKLVPYKLGRYFVTRIVAGGRDGTHVRIRLTQDANAPGFNIVSKGVDDYALERVGDNHEKDAKARDYTLDDRNRPALRALFEKVESLAKAIGACEGRTLVSLAIDNQPFAESPHPQVVAERLVAAMAPTVKDIAAHSSNANELVLRRMLADDRREEIFIGLGELVKKLDPVPDSARKVFAPLGIDRRSAPRAGRPPTQPPKLPIAGVAALTAGIGEALPAAATAAALVDEARRSRQTAGPGNRPPPPPGAASGGVPITSEKASSVSGQVALPGLTPPPTSSPGIAIPRTISSDAIDASTIEEISEDDVKPSTSGSVKIADLTRAIDAALDGVPSAPAGKSESKRAPAVVIDDDAK